MAHANIPDPSGTALVIIDVQEAFRGAVSDLSMIASRMSIAAKGFSILGLPVIVTEQYPKGLGRTVEEVALSLPDNSHLIEKTSFSSCGAGEFSELLKASGVSHVAVGGMETHICVNQTVHGLLEAGFTVHILADCVASRSDRDKAAGLAKMYAGGAVPSSVEMILFELLRDSRSDHFKEIQALIK